MTEASGQHIDLAAAFKSASQVLLENQSALNEADTVNHDHGSNMVKIFETISQAVGERKSAPTADQLEHAAQVLNQRSAGATGAIYADSLQNAAAQFKGRDVNQKNAMELISSLMGMGGASAQQSSTQGQNSDMLGSLLGGLMGGGSSDGAATQSAPGMDLLSSLLGGGAAPQQTQESPAGGGMDLLSSLLGGAAAPQQGSGSSSGGMDLLSSLLGGASGGATQQPAEAQQGGSGGGLNIASLLQMGLTYYQATQAGATPLQALIKVLLSSGSPLAGRNYRAQSGALVMQSLMQSLGASL